jgi:hypothetical protein
MGASSAVGGASGRGEQKTDNGKTKIKASPNLKVETQADWRRHRA